MDVFTTDKRSRVMRRVKSEGTRPEMIVRRLLHGLGYRYRLHRADLPGKPDLVFQSRKKVIFVHGCFWHWHHCPRGQRMPKSNTEYWRAKIDRNIDRDAKNQKELQDLGYDVLTVWECQTRDPETLAARLRDFLGPAPGEARP
ncbi:MAG: very short patch repair endonuclease [Desulfovibrionaceae bacterium]